MSNYSKIYWLTRLDSLGAFLTGLAICFFIAAFSYLLIAYCFMDKDWASADRKIEIDKFRVKSSMVAKWFIPLGFIVMLINSFIPSRNEALLIMAGGKTLDYVQSDTSLSKIPQQTTTIISQYLDNALKEMKKEK